MTRRRLAASLLTLTFGLAACGLTAAQREAARRFSHASTEVGTFAAAELPSMREATMALNTASVSIGTEKPGDLDGPFDPVVMPPRVLAAEALADYGRLLLALVEDTQAEELAAASDHFVASASKATGRDLSDEQLQAAGKVVVFFGRGIVEHRKARAIKAIVPKYQPVVDQLCDLLHDDFATTGLHLAQGLDAAIFRVQADADIALAETHGAKAQRAAAAEALRLADQTRARIDVVYPNAVKSLEALKRANAQLGAALRDDSLGIEDIKAFAEDAEELRASAKALSGR
jgi:phosphoglycolate phosphatase-like HAD superfamily hydrolase